MTSPSTIIPMRQMGLTTTNDDSLGKDEYFKDCYRLHHVIVCPGYKTNLIATFYKLTKFFFVTAFVYYVLFVYVQEVCVNSEKFEVTIQKLNDHGRLDKLSEQDSYGYTPLHYAAKYGHYEILEKLLSMVVGKF